MVVSLNSYKCAGVIYQIEEMGYTKKSNYPKRNFFLEVPTAAHGMQKTEVWMFTVMGDEAKSLDFYNEGDWVEILFRIEGRWWKPPDKDEKIHFQSLKPIDIHKGENPFDKGGEEFSQDPDDLSPDHQAELAKNVKDWENQREAEEPKLFDDDSINDLPF